MRKLRLAILKNESECDHVLWIKACQAMEESVESTVVDITKSTWLQDLLDGRFDGMLAVPPGNSISFKTLYDERVTILNRVCGIPVFPSLEEILIYENKKFLSYWLEANSIPHPGTNVFYYEKEALDFVRKVSLPLVGKTSVGASGSGVSILYSLEEAEQYIRKTFSGSGLRRRVGPKWRRKGFAGRVMEKLVNPRELRLKISHYLNARSESQRDFVLLQQYIPHTFEWRCVRIGDSFFAHKKLVRNEKASGSLLKSYDTPPADLLNFVKLITDLKNFKSQAIDIFVAKDGTYLVNEMQCIFGQSDPYQMLIDGQPGRYLFANNQWIFEAGDFNKYESFLLRLQTFTAMIAGGSATSSNL